MIKNGDYNELRVQRRVDFGLYLGDGQREVLLPKRYLTGSEREGDVLRVFVYNDSEGRPVATTEKPVATVGQFALMRCNQVNAIGAFLSWGLVAKELLVPFHEQRVKMQPGRSYVVYVYLDDATGRVVASAKLDKFLGTLPAHYRHRQRVDLLVVQRSEIGWRVIVDNMHWGMLYSNEMRTDVNVGEHHTGFVKQVRDDGKIDVTLLPIEKMRVDSLSGRILDHLKRHGGSMQLGDKSDPQLIQDTFGCSKKDFKKALSTLYKQHLITLGDVTKLVEK